MLSESGVEVVWKWDKCLSESGIRNGLESGIEVLEIRFLELG